MTPCACFACLDCAEFYEEAVALLVRTEPREFVDADGAVWPW